MDEKIRQMEDEMSRFEAEIGGPLMRPVIGANTYSQVARQLDQRPAVAAAPAVGYQQRPMVFHPPPPPPLMVPPQVTRPMPAYSTAVQIAAAYEPKAFEPVTNNIIHPDIIEKLIHSKPVEEEKKKPKAKGVSTAAELAIIQGKASSIMANANNDDGYSRGRGRRNKKIVRMAGGQIWEDPSLMDWDEDDFRIFAGDLGNDVTDEMLVRVFSKYSSFQKAKVVRDKRTNKTKGFGFISFKDPQDFIKAMKEMNGRYVGSRPIKLRKSSWKQRNIDTVKKKEKEKQTLIGLLTGR